MHKFTRPLELMGAWAPADIFPGGCKCTPCRRPLMSAGKRKLGAGLIELKNYDMLFWGWGEKHLSFLSHLAALAEPDCNTKRRK